MTTPTVLIDTGPITALLNRRDQHHEWVKEQMARARPPLQTCEAVLSEACFLLRMHPFGARAVLQLVEKGVVAPVFRLEGEIAPIVRLLVRYSDVPMSLADACLVRMTEEYPESVVMTLDRDFRIYRRHGRQVIPTLMPVRL